MIKKGISCKNLKEIIDEIISDDTTIVKYDEVFQIISKMKSIICMYNELNYLSDVNSDVIFLRNQYGDDVYNSNFLLGIDDIGDYDVNNLLIDLLKSLDESGLILILEPNNNLYIDIDYVKLIEELLERYEFDDSILILLNDIQKTAFVKRDSTFNKIEFNRIYTELVALVDFEKDDTKLKYLSMLISDLSKIKKLIR